MGAAPPDGCAHGGGAPPSAAARRRRQAAWPWVHAARARVAGSAWGSGADSQHANRKRFCSSASASDAALPSSVSPSRPAHRAATASSAGAAPAATAAAVCFASIAPSGDAPSASRIRRRASTARRTTSAARLLLPMVATSGATAPRVTSSAAMVAPPPCSALTIVYAQFVATWPSVAFESSRRTGGYAPASMSRRSCGGVPLAMFERWKVTGSRSLGGPERSSATSAGRRPASSATWEAGRGRG